MRVLALRPVETSARFGLLYRERQADLLSGTVSRASQPAMGFRISSLAGNRPRTYIPRSTCKMKAGIHPEYHETEMVCACGAVYHTRSTRRDIKIGICAACHPFFTGEQKFVDTAGRVEKFA